MDGDAETDDVDGEADPAAMARRMRAPSMMMLGRLT